MAVGPAPQLDHDYCRGKSSPKFPVAIHRCYYLLTNCNSAIDWLDYQISGGKGVGISIHHLLTHLCSINWGKSLQIIIFNVSVAFIRFIIRWSILALLVHTIFNALFKLSLSLPSFCSVYSIQDKQPENTFLPSLLFPLTTGNVLAPVFGYFAS